MNHISLFSGEGGFDLAAEWIGWNNIAHCEKNETCLKILKHYWPNAKTHTDIRTTDFTVYRGICNIITGGFPCQPYSTSGEQKGELDERHLWPEMLRAVREAQPEWVVPENVYGLVTKKFEYTFEDICSSLENIGYKVQPYIIPASAIGAEHQRNRVFFIAHAECFRQPRSGELLGQLQPEEIANRETSRFINHVFRNSMPYVCKSHNGFSGKLAEECLTAAGNAVVPQLAYAIFKTIEDYSNMQKTSVKI